MSQRKLNWDSFPSLPDTSGFAGMFAGVSNGALFCMGGANFPGKYPWEGGTKKWYSSIYKLEGSNEWIKLSDTLPMPLGYGVSVSHKERIYLIGGSSGNVHTKTTYSFHWNGNSLESQSMPELPFPMANMAGAIINDLIIVAGGSVDPAGPPVKKCLALDLANVHKGWVELPAWPGPARTLPVCAVSDGIFYLFSGEKTAVNATNEKFRYILQDAYSFTPEKKKGKWTGTWKQLAPLPSGASAAGTPLPVLPDGSIVISGGVDVLTALHTDPTSHPGITKHIQVYNPADDSWQLFENKEPVESRVTLPVVLFQNKWLYISGEIKPGIRTNSILALSNQ